VLTRIDSQMLHSLTYDQGREMAAHELFTSETGMTVYIAHPHSPWEHGINENTNEQYQSFSTNIATWLPLLAGAVMRVRREGSSSAAASSCPPLPQNSPHRSLGYRGSGHP